MHYRYYGCLCAGILSALLSAGFCWTDYKTLKTEEFCVIYEEDREKAEELLGYLKEHKRSVDKLTGIKGLKCSVFLKDIGIVSGGFADPLLNNIFIASYPPSSPHNNSWLKAVGVHEYAHLSHLNSASGVPSALSKCFGRLFLPNIQTPRWFSEGFATFAAYRVNEGGLYSGIFDAYIGAEVSEDRFCSLNKMTHTPFEAPWTLGPYLYGGEFLRFLSEAYGTESLRSFIRAQGGSLLSLFPPLPLLFPAIGIDRMAKKSFGKSYKELFSEWKRAERKRYSGFEMEGDRITSDGCLVLYPVICNGKLYYFRLYPKKSAPFWGNVYFEIREIDILTEKERVLISLTTSVSAPLKAKENKLYYAAYEFERSSFFDDYKIASELFELDLAKKKKKPLFKDYIRCFEVLDGEIIYVKDRRGFGSELWMYKKNRKELLFSFDILIKEIVADGNKAFICAKKRGGSWGIYSLNLEDGNIECIIDTPYQEHSISLHKDLLLFSANYHRVWRSYAYKDGELFCLTDRGYSTHPSVFGDNLYSVGLTPDGYEIFKKPFLPQGYVLPKERERGYSPSVEYTEGEYFDVIKTLTPSIRLIIPPYFAYLAGWDAVYENFYSLWLDRDSFMLDIHSRFFSPLYLNLHFTEEGLRWLYFNYPLIKRAKEGLSFCYINSLGELSIGFRHPKTEIRLDLPLISEDEVLSAIVERHLKKGKIDILFSLGRPPHASDLQIDYFRPFFEIRRGLWNPNLYLEDLFFMCGIHSVFYNEKAEIESIRLGLCAEVSSFLGDFKFPVIIGTEIKKEDYSLFTRFSF